jgi:hypothetical protein
VHAFLRGYEQLGDRHTAESDELTDSMSSKNADGKWPLAYTVVFVVVASACLWGAIIFGVMRLI